MGQQFSKQHHCQEHNHKTYQHKQKPSIMLHNNNNNNNPEQKSHHNINLIYFNQFDGQIKIDKQRKVYIKEYKIFENQQQQIKKLLDKRAQLKHKNFVTVNRYTFSELSQYDKNIQNKNIQKNQSISILDRLYICKPTQKYLIIQFQPLFFNIQSLIKLYCQQRRPLQQKQIRRIIKSVIECLIYLHQNDTYHGDIKPTTTFIHPKTNQIKLADSLLFHKGKTSFQIVMENPGSESFLTPAQLDKNKKGMSESLEEINQSEIFCLGMTMIQMMTFQSSMEAYNLQELQIKKQFVQRKFKQMQQYGYSYQLTDLALRCIHKIPQQRPRFQQILCIL